jgi:TPR repeat protein
MMQKLLWSALLLISSSILLYASLFESRQTDCDEGDAKACFEAGKTYSQEGYKEKDYDEKKAASKVAALYKRSCELGYAQGCTAYAMSYAADTHKDPDKDARYYFKKACESGDLTGCTMLQMMPEGK